jgi:hypothetical protein
MRGRTSVAPGRFWRHPAAWAVAAAVALALLPATRARDVGLPDRLSDLQFWSMITDASEPGGYFRSANITNLTSNELGYQHVIPDLVARTHRGVYLGVGPEQNFTYIAALRPAMAVIFDIRRGNLDLQLLYKALFELANDRAGFVSMLFSRPRPSGLPASPTADQLFAAFARVPGSEPLFRQNLKAIQDELSRTHQLPLPPEDLAGIEEIFQTFFWSGFEVRASPTYRELMTATDTLGVNHSYLASDDRFGVVKDLESRNLIVPVVGDFAGPKAIRAVGSFLKTQGATVSAFYLSNVEQYLSQDGKWGMFCANVATLPIDGATTFIRSAMGFSRGGFLSSLGEVQEEIRSCR